METNRRSATDQQGVWWMVGDDEPRIYSTRDEALSHGHSPVPYVPQALLKELLLDLANWDLSHKKSCPMPASNFQKNQPCKCGRDALLHRLRVAVGRAQP